MYAEPRACDTCPVEMSAKLKAMRRRNLQILENKT
jgi:hypothetical protein